MTSTTPSLINHLAIIMDGNGRWAVDRERPRAYGHVKGARVAKRVIEECSRLGIKYLTLYTFSTENWNRPAQEVSLLMKILFKYLRRERKNCIQNNIRFNCIGNITKLPEFVQFEIQKTIEVTAQCTGMTLTFALNYGGRQEILDACKNLYKDIHSGSVELSQIDETLFSNYLSTSRTPDPDLIIRTSGESRLSNFLTWQSVYSEILISPTYWPDFTTLELSRLLKKFLQIERRFGLTSDQIRPQTLDL